MTFVARAACAIGCLWLAGCVASGPRHDPLEGAHPARVELEATPFFPQSDYQCGPAALATILAADAVDVTAEELVPEVYLPARRGSLQVELVAATRARGRLPYVLAPQDDALFTELAAGHPVLVLQKLGAGPWPGWHYAVLVGYDRDRRSVLLRSGTTRRLEMSVRRFLLSWERGGRWAMLALAPGALPETADMRRYIDAAAGLEAVGRLDDAARAYRSASLRWPDAPLPWLGLANVAYARDDLGTAQSLYREALARDPADVAARNNHAEVLLQLGCPSAAAIEIAVAQEGARGSGLEAAVTETSRRIATAVVPDAADCPTLERDAGLVEGGARQ
jgi:tetratricopeptide (TPR) repeat protein